MGMYTSLCREIRLLRAIHGIPALAPDKKVTESFMCPLYVAVLVNCTDMFNYVVKETLRSAFYTEENWYRGKLNNLRHRYKSETSKLRLKKHILKNQSPLPFPLPLPFKLLGHLPPNSGD